MFEPPVASAGAAAGAGAGSGAGPQEGSVEALLAVEGLGPAERSARLVELERLQSRLDAARVAVLDGWDAEGDWALDAASSGAAWLAPRVGITGAAARERVKVTRWLRQAPLVAAALAEGRLTWAKVVLFARLVTEGCEHAFARDQAWLVDRCAELRVEWCARMLRHWASHADPDGADADDAARWERRSLFLAETWDGMGDLRANLTVEARLRFDAVLEAICDQLRRDEDPDDPAHVVRSAAQRRHDAFVELLRRAADWDAQHHKTARPSLVAWLDHQTITTTPRREASDDDAGGGGVHAGRWQGPPVTRAQAHRWLCDADVARLLTGPHSEILDLGRTARLYSSAQRKAIIARQGGTCLWPDCDRPAGWLDVHHLHHWDHGGPTDLDNGAALCRFHHHAVHDRGFHIRRGPPPTSTTTFHRPDGTPITT